MAIIKKRQIEILTQLNGEELEKALANLPISPEKLEDLFDYLYYRLEQESCDHTSRFTMQFLMESKLPFPKITAWLNENGGDCDCKVMENIESEWNKIFPEED
jgi:hypothetical protein